MQRLCWLEIVASLILARSNRQSHAFVASSWQRPTRGARSEVVAWEQTEDNKVDRYGVVIEPDEQENDRDGLVLELQSEIASLRATIAQQKDDYATRLSKLQTDADGRVQQAEDQVNAVQEEYTKYKVDIQQKLKQAASAPPAEIAHLKDEVQNLQQNTAALKEKLNQALDKLRQNRQDRIDLMAEMVAMKESYIDKLNDLEDQLESVQDERVRDQQEGVKRMAEMEQESKQKIRQAIEDGRKQVDELTIAYTKRLALKDEELARIRSVLGMARQTIQQKEQVIDQLEIDAQSIRKLLRKSLGLAKDRVGKRLRSLIPGKRP